MKIKENKRNDVIIDCKKRKGAENMAIVESYTAPSGCKVKICDDSILTNPKMREQKWENFIAINRDILIEDYKKTGIIGRKEVHSETVI